MENEAKIAYLSTEHLTKADDVQPEVQEYSTIAVIIPVFEDTSGLKRTLIALKNAVNGDKRFLVLVVNDSQSDEIAKVAKEFGVYHIYGRRLGSYDARNRGVKWVSAKWYVFLDADIQVKGTWYDAVCNCINKGVDYAGGPIQCEQREGFAGLFMELFEFPSEEFLSSDRYLPTANIIVSSKVFAKIGIFNSDLRSGGDLEFGRRVANEFQQCFVGEMAVTHPARSFIQYVHKMIRIGIGHHALERRSIAQKANNGFAGIARLATASVLGVRTFHRRIKKSGGYYQIGILTSGRLFLYYKALCVVYAYGRLRQYCLETNMLKKWKFQ